MIQDQYEYIMLDCPSQLSILAINALSAANQVLIPCKTDYMSYRGLDLLMGTIADIKQLVNPELKIMGVIGTLFEMSIKDFTRFNEYSFPKWRSLLQFPNRIEFQALRFTRFRGLNDRDELQRKIENISYEMNSLQVNEVKKECRKIIKDLRVDAAVLTGSFVTRFFTGGLTLIGAAGAIAKGGWIM